MDKKRYERHIIIDEIGEKSQRKIGSGSVLVIGAGGLGSSAIIHLAANGIGKLGIADFDIVEISNLHRQIIHFTDDIGKSKILSAAEQVQKINGDVKVETYNYKLTKENTFNIIKNYDFVIEATDNMESKLLINDLCVKFKIPFNHAGINKFFGTTISVIPGKTACIRCIFKNIKEHEKKISGVFGPVPGILGTIQAIEALKYIGDFGELLTNRMLFVDTYYMDFRVTEVKRFHKCSACGGLK